MVSIPDTFMTINGKGQTEFQLWKDIAHIRHSETVSMGCVYS